MFERLKWTPELVEAFWNGIAGSPLEQISFAKVAGDRVFRLLAPHLPPGATVLDFGAGSGDFTERLLQAGFVATALEPSDERARLLRERLGRYPNFRGFDVEAGRTHFDVVILMEVMEHILEEGFGDTLKLIASLVRPGGLVVVTTPNAENLDANSVYCPVSGKFFHRWQHIRSITPDGLVALLGEHGIERELLGVADFSDDQAVFDRMRALELQARQFVSMIAKLGALDRVPDLARLARTLGDAVSAIDRQAAWMVENTASVLFNQTNELLRRQEVALRERLAEQDGRLEKTVHAGVDQAIFDRIRAVELQAQQLAQTLGNAVSAIGKQAVWMVENTASVLFNQTNELLRRQEVALRERLAEQDGRLEQTVHAAADQALARIISEAVQLTAAQNETLARQQDFVGSLLAAQNETLRASTRAQERAVNSFLAMLSDQVSAFLDVQRSLVDLQSLLLEAQQRSEVARPAARRSIFQSEAPAPDPGLAQNLADAVALVAAARSRLVQQIAFARDGVNLVWNDTVDPAGGTAPAPRSGLVVGGSGTERPPEAAIPVLARPPSAPANELRDAIDRSADAAVQPHDTVFSPTDKHCSDPGDPAAEIGSAPQPAPAGERPEDLGGSRCGEPTPAGDKKLVGTARFDALDEPALYELITRSYAELARRADAHHPPVGAGPFDFRLGRETTIIYIGRRADPPAK